MTGHIRGFALFLAMGLLAACGGEPESPAPDESPAPAMPEAAPVEPPSETIDPPSEAGTRPADGVFPFQGRWASSFTDCSLEPGSAEEAPILITPNEIVGYENRCNILDVEVLDEAEGRYEVMSQCMAEGESFTQNWSFRVTGNTLMSVFHDGSITWTRCPAGPEGE